MKKFILILSLLPMLMLNFASTGFAVSAVLSPDISAGELINFPISETNKSHKNSNHNMWFEYIEALGEAEAEEKVISSHNYNDPYIPSQFGYALKDQFAIPNDRNYLEDEPPTV